MDYGFVRGPSKDGERGHLQYCRNRYNAYLLIKDMHTKVLWSFPTLSKDRTCNTITKFLDKYKNCHSTDFVVRTNQGGELARSLSFKQCINPFGFCLEATAPESSFRIGSVEREHCTLGNMM